MDEESATMIKQIEETKSNLAENLDKLQEQVADTVQVATESIEVVKDTVESAKDSVVDTIHSVEEALDIRDHVETHPWLSFASAVAVGFLVGRWWWAPTPQVTPVAG